MSLESYREMIRSLPLPTVEQTEQFAEYVTLARLWSRFLPPFPPGARFVFYLDPQAGRHKEENWTAGTATLQDVTLPSQMILCEMIYTSDYRQRYGCWNFAVGDASKEHLSRGVIHSGERYHAAVYDETGRARIVLPARICAQCSCRMTAFLGPPTGGQHGLPVHPAQERASQHDFFCFQIRDPKDRDAIRYKKIEKTLWYLTEFKSLAGLPASVIDQEAEFLRRRVKATLLRSRRFFAEFVADRHG